MWMLLYDLRVWWYRVDKAPALFVLLVLGVLSVLGGGFYAASTEKSSLIEKEKNFHARSLECLARNVYFEARGEPLAGQYAVAEVTMNRKASGVFPDTVCDVVNEKRWDPIRGRYVGAFSWTEFRALPAPAGEEWERAQRVAEAVYWQKHLPTLEGALYFHAAYIRPDWAKEKKLVSRIGRHVFYR
ncbi:MAG TPA: cell wall hydrolase [Burkholderiales bacterium]|jgi:spore germination cell wall hydrolase CwlJ-like protein